MQAPKLSFVTLLLMISFASVNAVLFTPALPAISHFFAISTDQAQLTITIFLIGYTFGQLIYGPIANRFGRKPALYLGMGIQLLSCLLCAQSAPLHNFNLLLVGRLLQALGAGVGLKMTFTLVNECYDPKMASQKIAYLMLAFAITPSLSIALGGYLTEQYAWNSCFYALLVYGLLLLIRVMRLPETLITKNLNALKLSHLVHAYKVQFMNTNLILGALLMGCSTGFIYIFAALAPFIAINGFGMSSSDYGMANLVTPLGLIIGSLLSANLIKSYSLKTLLNLGVVITAFATLIMLLTYHLRLSVFYSLFLPTVLVYFGICFINANITALILNRVQDKAHGAAVLSFINMGFATIVLLASSSFSIDMRLLVAVNITLATMMIVLCRFLKE